ncbi:MAG: hypothetical protein CMP47_08415 [Rickettsiales bacterium]|nr:hypothetical protein [Rickettsiales bacterium]
MAVGVCDGDYSMMRLVESMKDFIHHEEDGSGKVDARIIGVGSARRVQQYWEVQRRWLNHERILIGGLLLCGEIQQ